MKRAPFCFILLLTAAGSALASDLRVRLDLRFNGAPLVFDSPANTNAAGQAVSISRLDFLLSDFALRRTDGAWINRTNWFASVRARDGRTSFVVNAIPPAQYRPHPFQRGPRTRRQSQRRRAIPRRLIRSIPRSTACIGAGPAATSFSRSKAAGATMAGPAAIRFTSPPTVA